MKLHIRPHTNQIETNSGIGQVVKAQYQYLPALGFTFVDDPREADVIASHITADGLERVDVLHCHGLYWTGDPGSGSYVPWHNHINKRIVEAARRALLITVPSEWVAEPFKRDMHLKPRVIRHGVEADQWVFHKEKPYFVLWNKTRAGDVCDPTPAQALALKGVPVFSTFVNDGFEAPSMRVIGSTSWEVMKTIIEKSKVYLATTQETYGIGTLEALAAGVPVLGYAHGGTLDIVEHKVNGYLVKPGDTNGLLTGLSYILEHYETMANAARARAVEFDWQAPMKLYAEVYQRAFEMRKWEENRAVSIVITNYNYARYLPKAVASVEEQMRPGDEIIIVDDGSKDESILVIHNLCKGKNTHRVLEHPTNKGVAAARNAGIRMARNKFFVCLDADDQIGAGFLEAGSLALQKNRALGIAFAGIEFEDENQKSNLIERWQPKPLDWEFQTRIPDNPQEPPPTNIPTPSACMMRKSMWARAGGYLQEYAPGEDTEFVTRALALGYEAEPLPGIYTRYLRHTGSASKTKKYGPISTYLPWMKDKQYPMAAPTKKLIPVRSYSKPLVSVIIPVGAGHEQFIPGCLNAINGQTFRDWEVILIDDSRGAISIESLLGPYPYVRLIKAPHKGVGAARNAGIQAARGDLLYFIDVDDLAFPDALQRLLDGYYKNAACYVYSNYMELWPRDGRAELLQTPDYDRVSLFDLNLHPITVLLDRQRIIENGIKFDETMPGFEDWDFFLQMAIKGLCGKKIPETTAYIRRNTGHFKEITSAEKQRLRGMVLARYNQIRNGAKAMTDCGCGPSGQAIINYKKRMTGAPVFNQPLNLGGVTVSQTVRMEFIGAEIGPMQYRGNEGRVYRASANPLHKYQNVHPADVQKLINTGKFRVLPRDGGEAPTPAPLPDPALTGAGVIHDPNDPALLELFQSVTPPATREAPALDPTLTVTPPAPTGATKTPAIPPCSEMTVAEIQQAAPTAGKAILLAWKAEEEDNKKRTGALRAIEDALVKVVA